MENCVGDQSNQAVDESNTVSEVQDSATELKAKMHGLGEGDPALTNHVVVEEKHTNGHAMNNIDARSSEKSKEHSSSKSKDHHSSSSSKHKEHSSSSSKSHDSSSSKHRDDSSKSKEHKHRDDKHKDRHREGGSSSSSSKDKHKESSSSRDKHHESSSSSKDKHREGSSSHHKDKHKEGSSSSSSKDKYKDGSHSSSKDKHRDSSHSSSSKDKHKESSSKDRHKDGSSKEKSSDGSSHSKSRDGDKHSSSHKDKHRDDKDKSRDKERSKEDKEREKNREHKDKHREDKDKSREDRDKHKEKSREEKEKSREHKDKERSKDHKHRDDKERSKEKPRESVQSGDEQSQSSKHKDKNTESKSKDEKLSSPKVKSELGSGDQEVSVKREPMSPSKSLDTSVTVKKEVDSDDDAPLALRLEEQKTKADRKVKTEKRTYEESSDDEPLSSRAEKVKKIKKEEKAEKVSKKRKAEDDEFSPEPKKSKPKPKVKKEKNDSIIKSPSPTKAQKKKQEEEKTVWKWWEEEKRDDGVKWNFLEHKGPVFAPDYEPLPKDVKFLYDGKEMQLSEETEEVAGFFGKMLEHDYTTRKVFQDNFFKDWRKVMTPAEKEKITDLKKCDFRQMHAFFVKQSEERKNRTKEEKKKLKEQNEALMKEYGFCKMDGHVEKIGNFRIEPPGLFRGRGDHPKQGQLKKRVTAEQVIINCSKESLVPPPPKGHKWKEVRHDNTVSWLACWTENVQAQTKYVMLNAASRLKGEKDWQKYEVARRLNKQADKIRAQYREDWKSKEMRIRQRAVALYFIDKLALRAGNEKEEGETADTVGCCSLRVEHITLNEEKDGKPFVVEFDFLGKDSIRYYNAVPIEKKAFKNLQLFMENKSPGDDLFDRLNTTILNKHLHDLMDGLTAKVFRTFNASKTLQEQLDLLTVEEDPVSAKLLSYNRANRAVAVLCNHQRAVPKNFDKQMENLQTQIDAKRQTIKEAKKALKSAKVDYKAAKSERNRKEVDKRKKAVERLEEQLNKLEIKATDKDENKEIALGTSKLNYLDPRISVAWCKKWNVPIEKIYNKTQRDKFRWAIDMAGPEFSFTDEPSEMNLTANEEEEDED